MKGVFITFEGPDGAGKSTQIRLLSEYLEHNGHKVLVTREPGGCDIAEEIREILLDSCHAEMSPMTEMLLYAAARAQHVDQVILPALDKGTIVICDRFTDSSMAYQGIGRNLGMELVEEVNRLAAIGLTPDVTFLFLVTPETARRRMLGRSLPDRIESEDGLFHKRVLEGFESLIERYPGRIRAIDSSLEIDEIYEMIKGYTEELLELRAR